MKQKVTQLYYSFIRIFHNHEAFVVLTISLTALIVVILRINNLNNLPADQLYYDQAVSEIKSVNFNEDAINKIEQLRDSNVEDLGTQLPVDRTNPFNE